MNTQQGLNDPHRKPKNYGFIRCRKKCCNYKNLKVTEMGLWSEEETCQTCLLTSWSWR